MLPIYFAALELVSRVTGRVRRDDSGATAVEYGLMVALIAGAIVFIVWQLGVHLGDIFSSTDSKITIPSGDSRTVHPPGAARDPLRAGGSRAGVRGADQMLSRVRGRGDDGAVA